MGLIISTVRKQRLKGNEIENYHWLNFINISANKIILNYTGNLQIK